MNPENEDELISLRAKVAQYEAWFRAIDTHSDFDFWFKNTQSQYTYANPHFAKSIGHDLCTLRDSPPEDIFKPDHVERIKALDKKVMAEGAIKRVIPCDASGRLQMHEEHRFAVTNTTGEPIGLGCFAFEITEKSLAGEALNQTEKIANLCSWRWSADTNQLISCSEQIVNFLGVSRTEAFKVFPNRAQTLVIPEDRHVFKVVENRLNGTSNHGYAIEYRLRRKDGQIIHIRETTELLSSTTSASEYLGVMQDITQEKITESTLIKLNETLETKVKQRTKELRTSKNIAETANNAKSQFLATMSHELRTPMNGVLGLTEALKDTPLDKDQVEVVDMIYSSGSALVTIMNDILDFSKLEAGLIELDSKPFNINDVVKEIISLFATTADNRNLDIKAIVHPNVPEYMMGDVRRIRQVLYNLVSNAVKFTREGHVVLEIDTHINGNTASVYMTVTDTGIGIAEDKFEIIFDEFTQAEQSTKRNYDGAGLGLSITKKIVDAMPKGRISVESTLTKGSTFTVGFDLDVSDFTEGFELDSPDTHDTEQETSIAADASDDPDNSGFNYEIALVVSGNESLSQMLKETLESWGLNPVLLTHAKQALDVLRQTIEEGIEISVVVSDYDLGQYSGSDLIRAIKEDRDISHIKTVLLSPQTNNMDGEDSNVVEIGHPSVNISDLKHALSTNLQDILVSKNINAAHDRRGNELTQFLAG